MQFNGLVCNCPILFDLIGVPWFQELFILVGSISNRLGSVRNGF